MRLLRFDDDDGFCLIEFFGKNIPQYGILSHTWGEDHEEVTFKDLAEGTGKNKSGYRKLTFCGKQAAKDNLQYFWVDTCCIDKSSSAELSEAINSMFRWYQDAARCYVYLSDVSVSGSIGDESPGSWKPAFKRSRWFTRRWTLQELLAPESVEFFSEEELRLGDKQSLDQTLHGITGIAIQALRGSPLYHFSANERISWAEKREAKREEDEVYSLLGIFDIHMPLIYGEGREKALIRLWKEINESILPLSEDQKRMLLESLRFNQMDARQLTIKNAHAKTCKWLLEKSEYLDWLNGTKLGEHRGFLWIKGKPGTGKSTLMKFALASARETMKDKIVISFFFNARGEDLEKSTIGAYRSLLLQLLERIPTLQSVFNSLHLSTLRISISHQWSVESLKTLLEQAVQSLQESSVVCFIDALDESEERQIRDMISFFEHVSELAVSAGVKFQVCFSSRHYPHITIQKVLDLVLEAQRGHNQDITNYLSSELKIGNSKATEQIRMEIQEKASGIFMWVVLVVGMLNKEHDSGRMYALQRRLREIPSDLHELFRDILTRDSNNKDELVLCIQWVLFAKQPLSPEQLYFAILSGVEPEALSRWYPEEITIDIIHRFILDSSKGLAEITTSGAPKVQFIHESIKDFLLKENGLGNIWPDLRRNFQGQSHERLKHCCLNYLNVNISTHREFCNNLPKASSRQAAARRKSASGAYPFLEYAVRSVLYHADMAAGYGIPQENLTQSVPFNCWIKLNNLFEEHEEHRHTEDVSLLYVLAEGNMSNLIRGHPSIFSCLEVEKERYGPPLFAALATKSNEAVRTFVDVCAATKSPDSQPYNLCGWYRRNEGVRDKFGHGFKFLNSRTTLSYLAELGDEVIFALALEIGNIMPNSKDQDGRTPLSWAATNGHEKVVKLLIGKKGIDVNSRDNIGRTPLLWAIWNRNEAVVKLLIETKAIDINYKDSDGWTPLLWAAGNNRKGVVKLLLEKEGININCRDSIHGQTPLSLAAENGHGAVVKLLVEKEGIDVNYGDWEGRTPLSWAAGNGHRMVVKLLLKMGKADVDLKDLEGRTPLSWATGKGNDAIVKLLLNIGGANINSKDSDGKTPLSWAAKNGHEAVVKLLLKTGKADVNLKDGNGRTPLWWATEKGNEAIVRQLLETGKVDVNLKDSEGRTPLSWAAEMERTPLSWATGSGHEAIVKLLLGIDEANINSKDSGGQTPLSWAAKNGHEAVVKLLLKNSQADVNLEDSDGRTPLWWAVKKRNDAIVRQLLETGKVNVNLKDLEGQTPLWWAVKKEHEATVKLLLEIGKADANLNDLDGQTPLSWAAKNGRKATVKLLLETGKADISLKDSEERTPLSWAAKNGHEAIVKLLLETGKADVNLKDRDGQTPLSWAAKEGHEATVRQLLKIDNANVNLKDPEERTPLSWAATNGHVAVAKLLIGQKDIDVNSGDSTGRTPLLWAVWNRHEAVVKLLIKNKAIDVNCRDLDGWTPLLWAAGNNYKAVVRLLLEKEGININSGDSTYGQTPLSSAAENGHGAVVRLLVEKEGIDINYGDWEGRTPLSWAAGNGHKVVVKLLLKMGKADTNLKDSEGRTPLWWAVKNGHEAINKLLLDAGKVDVNLKDSHQRTLP